MERFLEQNFFSPDEYEQIQKQRRYYNNKLKSVVKSLKDYQEYIAYEKTILKKIKDRGKNPEYKCFSLELSSRTKILDLYENALEFCSDNYQFYLEYFYIAQEYNLITIAPTILENMLQKFSDNIEIWKIACNWYEEMGEKNNVMKTIRRGLMKHENNDYLYKEAIKFNIKIYMEQDFDKKEQIIENIVTYVKQFCANINDIHQLIDFLNFLTSYNFLQSAQNLVIKDLMNKHSDKELLWHVLAEKERQGFSYTDGLELSKINEDTDISLQRCFLTYHKGLTEVSPFEKAKLWCKYLECLYENRQKIKKENVLQVFDRAHKEQCLTEDLYIKWLELVDERYQLDIVEKGLSIFSKSITLWKLRLRLAILTNDVNKVDYVFNEGVDALEEHSLPLWSPVIRFHFLKSPESAEQIYKKAIEQPNEIARVFKSEYLEYIALFKDMKEARQLYKKIALRRPNSKELHLTMSTLESAEIDFDLDHWGYVHQLACEQFGETDIDVWIEHILFQRTYNKDYDKARNVYLEAEKILEKTSPWLLHEFEEKYKSIT